LKRDDGSPKFGSRFTVVLVSSMNCEPRASPQPGTPPAKAGEEPPTNNEAAATVETSSAATSSRAGKSIEKLDAEVCT
jgi:hypothetical protein